MLISGTLIGMLTFPGIIVHELGHLLLCRIANVRVKGWCLFQLKNPMGFVVHEIPESVWKGFLITFGPFFVNSILTVLLAVLWFFAQQVPILNLFLLWMAFSIGAHAFPSTGDAKSLWGQTTESFKKKQFWNAIFVPFVIIIYIGAILSIFWFDFIYAGALIFGTSAFLSAPTEFGETGWTQKFENQYFSFSYPFGLNKIDSGTEFETIKEAIETNDYKLFFVGEKFNAGIVVYGTTETPTVDLNSFGNFYALLAFDEKIQVEKKQLTNRLGREWFEIAWIDDSDPKDKTVALEGITYCKQNRVVIKVLSNQSEDNIFNQIANSFKCKQEFEGALE